MIFTVVRICFIISISWLSTIESTMIKNTPFSNYKNVYQSLLRKEATLQFDINAYPFKKAIQNILQSASDEEILSLEDIHHFKVLGEIINDNSGSRCSKQQMIWNQERGRRNINIIKKYEEFDNIYDRFIKEYIGPSMGGGRIIYQRAPTLRIMLPSVSTAKLHNDRDYHHQPSEINYWLPLTSSYGNNSLWIESEPNKCNWHPLTLKYGQCGRFYGNLCRHYTNPNDTGRTRISIDFRVVSDYSGEHDANFDFGVPRGSKARYEKKFDIDGYYKEIFIPNDPMQIKEYNCQDY